MTGSTHHNYQPEHRDDATPCHVTTSRLACRDPLEPRRVLAALAWTAAALTVAAAYWLLLAVGDAAEAPPVGEVSTVMVSARPAVPQPVPDLVRLPNASTFGVVVDAPPDVNRSQTPSGHVVHPTATVPVYSAPGGAAIAALPAKQVTSDTWVPVIAQEPGWLQVLLPVRPNGSSGWLSTQDTSLEHATSPYLVSVDRSSFQLTLHRDGVLIGRWTIGIGKPGAETPPGRTFLLASLVDPHQRFSPVILPLGTHSASLETFGGGPGTTGIHGWPTPDVFGKPSSDGCVRIPADALQRLSTEVPLGTPVLID